MAVVLLALLASLTLAAPASDASPQAPLVILVAPPDAAGAPSHVVEFAQEHVAEQLKSRGVVVVRIEDVTRRMPAAKRRQLLRCNRTEEACLQALGAASNAEVVLVPELVQFVSGYRTGARAYSAKEGTLIAENSVPGVSEDQLLDALTRALDVVIPRTRTALRGPPPLPPMPEPPPGAVVKPATPLAPAPGTTPETGTAEHQGSSLRRWAWLPAAGGVVLAGVGTVFYLQAGDKHDQLAKGGSVDSPRSAQETRDLVSSGKSAQTVSRVAFGLGAAGVVTGLVMFLLPGGERAPVKASAAVGSGGGMVGLSGTWQ